MKMRVKHVLYARGLDWQRSNGRVLGTRRAKHGLHSARWQLLKANVQKESSSKRITTRSKPSSIFQSVVRMGAQ
jgi:hypothetical protein